MNQAPTALILAGGFATRLWPLTEKRAKPLLPLAGKSLIGHIIEGLPTDMPVIISTNQQFEEAFQAFLSDYPERDIQVFIEDSSSDKTKKGALAATALVIDHYGINSPLLLIAGDNYFGFDIQDFLGFYEGNTILASYDTKSLESARQFGVVGVEGKRLVEFVEKPQDPPSTLISTGCYLFAPEHLPEIKTYSQTAADNLGGIFEHLLEQKADIDVFTFNEDWIDIGSFASYLAAHRQLLPEQHIHAETTLENTHIGPSVQIGSGCTIVDSHLEDVIIMDNCTIRDAHLRNCVVDHDAFIEGVDLNHKMIRSGAQIRG